MEEYTGIPCQNCLTSYLQITYVKSQVIKQANRHDVKNNEISTDNPIEQIINIQLQTRAKQERMNEREILGNIQP